MENKIAWEKYPEGNKREEVFQFAENYRKFISDCKTERECVTSFVEKAEKAGFVNLEKVIAEHTALKAGDRVYANNMGKGMALFVIGKESMEKGMNILGAHIDQDLEIYRIVVDTWNRTGTRVSYTDLPANLRTHQNTASFLDRFKVVAGNLPYAQTIVAHIARDGHYFIHPDIEQNRSITPREAARIQTFPDNYYFESKKGVPSRTLAFKQIGNAVPVCLAYHIASALLDRFNAHN